MGLCGILEQSRYGLGNIIYAVGVDEEAILSMGYRLRDSPGAPTYNWLAKGVCFRDHYGETILTSGQCKDITSAVALELLVPCESAKKRDGVPNGRPGGDAMQTVPIFAIADYHVPSSRNPANDRGHRLDNSVYPLSVHEAADR